MDLSTFHRFDAKRGLPLGSQPDKVYDRQQMEHARQSAVEYSTHVVDVDSAQRDLNASPSSSEYVVYFRTPLTNIVRVDLASAEVPNTCFNVTTSNNAFVLEEVVGNSSPHLITFDISEGYYDITDLVIEIERLLNLQSSSTSKPYSVGTLGPQNKVIIRASSAVTRFRLPFSADNTCRELLGFPGEDTPYNDTVSSTDPSLSHALVSPGYVNTPGDRFLFLSSPELDTTLHGISYSSSTGGLVTSSPPNCFAKIALIGPPGSMIAYTAGFGFPMYKEFRPPLARLDSLRIRWLRRDGSLADFRNMDNSVQLHFKCVSRSLGSPNFPGYF
jgi:hypothetical protein